MVADLDRDWRFKNSRQLPGYKVSAGNKNDFDLSFMPQLLYATIETRVAQSMSVPSACLIKMLGLTLMPNRKKYCSKWQTCWFTNWQPYNRKISLDMPGKCSRPIPLFFVAQCLPRPSQIRCPRRSLELLHYRPPNLIFRTIRRTRAGQKKLGTRKIEQTRPTMSFFKTRPIHSKKCLVATR